jgi:hypothetical protein
MSRRSKHIQLLAMGTVILGGCAPDLPADRYVYNSHPECVRDWGDENCQHSPGSGHGGGGGWFGGGDRCYGPRYNTQARLPSGQTVWTGNADAPAIEPKSGRLLGSNSIKVSRGGFGSFARSMLSHGG